MKVKTCLQFLIKLAISGVLALLILSLLCLVYYNPPLATAQPDGFTNFKYTPNSHWSFMTEGNGRGRINSLGYNGLSDPVEGKKTVCFLGSSHTEALQVNTDRNFVSLLEKKLSSDTVSENDFQCLNLGVSGHFFETVVSNFENFAAAFENVSHVVIEVNNVEFSEEQVEKMLNGEYHSELEERSFLHQAAQRIPYLRLLVKQYNDLQKNKGTPSESADSPDYENYAVLLDPVMKKLSAIAKEKGFELTVLQHNSVYFDETGEPCAQMNAKAQEQFRKSCEDNGIGFVCTNESFLSFAAKQRELPYGFSNTSPGSGHLNEAGHRLIADLLYSEVFSEEVAE